MYGLLPRRDENAEVIVPVDASTPGGLYSATNWAWSSWQQIISSTALGFPFLLCGVHLQTLLFLTAFRSTISTETALEIGTGASGSEKVVAQFADGLIGQNNGNATIICVSCKTLLCSPVVIPANTRIAWRISERNTTLSSNTNLYLTGYNALKYSPELHPFGSYNYIKGALSQGSSPPIVGLRQKKPVRATSGSGGFVYGSWVILEDKLPSAYLISGVRFGNSSLLASIRGQARIGVGQQGGSEVVVAKVGLVGTNGLLAATGVALLPRPLLVYQGESIYIQVASSSSTASWEFSLIGYELIGATSTSTSTTTTSSSTSTSTTSTLTTTSTTSTTTSTSTSSTSVSTSRTTTSTTLTTTSTTTTSTSSTSSSTTNSTTRSTSTSISTSTSYTSTTTSSSTSTTTTV